MNKLGIMLKPAGLASPFELPDGREPEWLQRYPEIDIALEGLKRNRQELGQKLGICETVHTPPAAGHYPDNYLWDEDFAAIINSLSHTDPWVSVARAGLTKMFGRIQPNGFMANIEFAEDKPIDFVDLLTKDGRAEILEIIGRGLNPERWLAFGRKARFSNYTQPPIHALATREAYEASLLTDPEAAAEFMDQIYPKLRLAYAYFDNERTSQGGKLIRVFHPHETGRDSDETFDFAKPHRLTRRGELTPIYIDKANIVLDYFDSLRLSRNLARAGGDPGKIRQNFDVTDVMMNCIYIDNLYEMAQLADSIGNPEDKDYYLSLAQEVESEILTKLWSETDQKFYNIDNNSGRQIKKVGVNNLFPLMLPNLSLGQLSALLDLMDKSFDVPYPIPSAAIDPNDNTPNRESERLWRRRQTWINTNWLVVERGLLPQLTRPEVIKDKALALRLRAWASKIATQSKDLLDKNGAHEYYDSITGEGQRPRVKNFAWSYLAYVMRQSVKNDALVTSRRI